MPAPVVGHAAALLSEHQADIERLCHEFQVRRISVVGSSMTSQFNPETSDIDLLVEYAPEADLGPWLFRFAQLRRELETVLGHRVDLVTTTALRDPAFGAEARKTMTPVFHAPEVAEIAR